MTLTDILPRRLRYGIYIALVVIGVVLGSIQAWCTAAGADVPTWHAPSLAVLGYLSSAIGLVAAANVGAPKLAITAEQRATLTLLRDALDPGDEARDGLNALLGIDDPPHALRWDDEPGSDDLRGERD